MKVVRTFVAGAIVLLLVSCNLQPMWNVGGKWKQVEGSGVLDVQQNGVLTFVDENTSLTARYIFTRDKHLEVYAGGLGALILKVSENGKELTLTNAQGVTTKFKKTP